MGLNIYQLSKSFGETKAVQNLNISLEKGHVLGLLGRNGAGKTTTIKMLLGLLTPDQGEITWEDGRLDRSKVSIGYLPEERGLYLKSKINEQLRYFGELEGMSRKQADDAIDYWLDKLDIAKYKTKKASELSKGNQQKIQLIATLMHNPELIILDEPFSGLDPVNANLLSSIIEEQITAGKTVILSSHRMEQIESFCEQICLMKEGEVIVKGRLDDIKQNYGYRNLSLSSNKTIETALNEWNIPFETKQADIVIRVRNDKEAIQLLNRFEVHSIPIRNFKMLEPTLNEIFIERVG
ncbi:ABC transporter ATP-binding protein [Heyndrickxia shackletonii]|uniref:ABC transporter ATP-binding protein n=1 Tax=Heyndrickxia shackletonii TaxID=157838 RepID=A0A0Q3WR27_9BACI|nr:ATP-binding cassette domain-containing protein [Heyndrickxia shackletonii]KQL50467.1 ABC transporter ATP-binding protein [Heyndrickxia shackletonii]NEZ01538.1 ATP-binding cassette domain-containing protein [Heyndrickxia shackletonii]